MADAAEITLPDDDVVIAFRTEHGGISGRLIRLGPALQAIAAAHAYPDVVNERLAEALSLAGLLGSALPRQGNLNFEARTSGPIALVAANYEAPGKLRGYARFAADAVASAGDTGLKDGHVALTYDQGEGSDRYQGIFPLDDLSLPDAVVRYFEEREGLPTSIALAVARHFTAGSDRPALDWRAGALMMQRAASAAADDDWQRARLLAATVEPHELLDPTLSSRALLLRLFHEEGVIVDRVIPLSTFCRCSPEKVARVLASFGRAELADLVDETGNITVKCEFCGRDYPVSPDTLT